MLTQSDKLIAVREAARKSGRTAETVRRWIWEGKLPAQKLGNQLFVREADLARRILRLGGRDVAGKMSLLVDIRASRERIARRLGGDLDILTILDSSREAHP